MNIIELIHIQFYRIMATLYDIWNCPTFWHFYWVIFKRKL